MQSDWLFVCYYFSDICQSVSHSLHYCLCALSNFVNAVSFFCHKFSAEVIHKYMRAVYTYAYMYCIYCYVGHLEYPHQLKCTGPLSRAQLSIFLTNYRSQYQLHFTWVVEDAKCMLVMCVCVCLSFAACPHYCMDPDVTWRNGRGCPLVVHCWADLQSVHGLRCCDNMAQRRNVSECLYSLYAWFNWWHTATIGCVGHCCTVHGANNTGTLWACLHRLCYYSVPPF